MDLVRKVGLIQAAAAVLFVDVVITILTKFFLLLLFILDTALISSEDHVFRTSCSCDSRRCSGHTGLSSQIDAVIVRAPPIGATRSLCGKTLLGSSGTSCGKICF